MIVPNLLVENLPRSVNFYTQILRFETMMVLTAENGIVENPSHPQAVFATLSWQHHQLMLQTRAHRAASGQSGSDQPTLSGSLYIRDFAWEAILPNLPVESILSGPKVQWYGMAEITIQDPDGYMLVLGRREGAPPAR